MLAKESQGVNRKGHKHCLGRRGRLKVLEEVLDAEELLRLRLCFGEWTPSEKQKFVDRYSVLKYKVHETFIIKEGA